MTKTHKYVWCPRDDHGDHEIHLEYVVHPGFPASLYGPAPHPAEDAVIEIVSASEGGLTLGLSLPAMRAAVLAIEIDTEWDDGQPDEATEWRAYDADC